MKTENLVCDKSKCTGCMLCTTICACSAVKVEDVNTVFIPRIDSKLCISCKRCSKYCQSNIKIEYMQPIKWYQGWAVDTDIRKNSSSGGLATAFARKMIENGGYVVCLVYEDGKFILKVSSNEEMVFNSVGSKYVKSLPGRVYEEVKRLLLEEKEVLFIGLPCQVSAIKIYIEPNLQKNLYTVDLICHGAPSPELFSSYVNGQKIRTSNGTKVSFRSKNQFGITIDGKRISEFDCYTKAFLEALTYTEGCYNCKYARIERISDITIGDAWGSDLSQEEQQKGISFVMYQTEKGRSLLEHTELHLEEVDIDRIKACNLQLVRPSRRPKRRKIFFFLLKFCKFDVSVKMCYPVWHIKQKLRLVVKKCHFIHI